jgi:hypothetical protein
MKKNSASSWLFTNTAFFSLGVFAKLRKAATVRPLFCLSVRPSVYPRVKTRLPWTCCHDI